MNRAEALTAMTTALNVRGYSHCTERNYLYMAGAFLTYVQTAGPGKDVEGYANGFVELLQRTGKEATTINLYVAAIKFLFEHVFKKPLSFKAVPNLKTAKTLPDIFSADEMRRILSAPMNSKHRLFIMMVYGCGLRCGEAVKIRVGDLKRDRGLLYLRGKGNRDRIVSIADIPAHLLDEYTHGKGPDDWLFKSQVEDYHITKRTASMYLQHACEKAGVQGTHNLHKLRHTFAGHMLEGGTDVRYIQEILGHKDIRTTLIYTKINKEHLGKIQSPLAKVL